VEKVREDILVRWKRQRAGYSKLFLHNRIKERYDKATNMESADIIGSYPMSRLRQGVHGLNIGKRTKSKEVKNGKLCEVCIEGGWKMYCTSREQGRERRNKERVKEGKNKNKVNKNITEHNER